MSEFLYYSGEFSELAELETKIRELETLLASGEVDASVDDIYQATLAGLRARANELAGSETIIELVSDIAKQADATLTSLDKMAETVGSDLMDPSYIDRQQEVSETLQKVAGFAERYPDVSTKIYPFAGTMALSSAELIVEAVGSEETEDTPREQPVIAEEEPTLASLQREHTAEPPIEHDISPEIHQTTDVPITFGIKNVRIGKQGRIIPYSLRSSGEHFDYSDLRREALMHMISHQGEELTPHELWRAITKGQLEFDGHKMAQVRVWLQNLTYRRSPLIGHNATRGAGSRYWVHKRFNLSLNLDYDPYAEQDEALVQSIGEIEPQKIEKLTPFAIDYTDLYVAATHLARFNNILKDSGCGEITKEMIDSLLSYAPDWSDACNNEKIIKQRRRETYMRVKAFLADENRLFKFLDRVSPDSGKLAFVEFLSDLDDQQRELIDRLITAKEESGRSTTPRGIILKGETRIFDENDSEILPLDRPTEEAPIDQILEDERGVESEQSDEEFAQSPPIDEGIQKEQVETGPEVAEKDAIAGIVESRLEELTELWIANFEIDGRYPRSGLRDLFRTRELSRVGIDNRFKSFRHGDTKLSYEEVMTIIISSDPRLQNSRKNKKIIQNAIREKAASLRA